MLVPIPLNPLGSPVCGCIDKASIGKRELWCRCGLKHGHPGRHYDAKRGHYWVESFYFDEFEHGTAGLAKKPKRKRTKSETKDLLVKRGAKYNLLAQHREEQRWAFLKRTTLTQPRVEQIPIALEDDNGYHGEW
jgi:hypothetical protein